MKRSDGPSRDRVDAWLDRLRLDEGDGPALPIADDAALELVRRARERCEPAPRAKLSRLPRWPLIGIAVVVASSAAAAALGELPGWLAWTAPTATRAPNTAASAASEKKPRPAATPRATPPEPPVAPIVAAPSEPSQREAPQRELPQHEPPEALAASKRSARPPASKAPALDDGAPVVRAEHGPPQTVAPDSPPAADRLGAANRARAERRYADALAAYRDVIERYPKTRQAQIAAVAAGELELERGDARAAEPLFQRVPHDAEVGAEALFGLAETYRARGRVVEERSALDRFVQLYPSNPLAAAARQRLSRLEEAMNTGPRAPR
jgi:tetratricopeptide (TPR) repeat protein